MDLIAPSLARTFERKTWLGEKVRHVIEPRFSFRNVSGVDDFNATIRFDQLDVLSNTRYGQVSLVNRLFAKNGGVVSEVFSWELAQRRYFDPTFGGAVTSGRRNVVLSAVELTPYAFLDAPRSTSPVVSVFRATPKPGFGVEWRADYDPRTGGVTNSSFNADMRISRFLIRAGHSQVHSDPVLSPSANQFQGTVSLGNQNGRGWNAAFQAIYDYRAGRHAIRHLPGDLQHGLLRFQRAVPQIRLRVQEREPVPGVVRGGQYRLLRHAEEAGAAAVGLIPIAMTLRTNARLRAWSASTFLLGDRVSKFA